MSEGLNEGLSFAMLLKRSGLTQGAIAKRVNVRQATVSAWVNGHTVPTLTPWQIQQLLLVLDCSLEELVLACHPNQEQQISEDEQT